MCLGYRVGLTEEGGLILTVRCQKNIQYNKKQVGIISLIEKIIWGIGKQICLRQALEKKLCAKAPLCIKASPGVHAGSLALISTDVNVNPT